MPVQRPFSATSRFKRVSRALVGLAVLAVANAGGPAAAQEFAEGTLLSDTEIGMTLAAFGKPIFTAGGLDASQIQLHMVVDDSINAFATRGNNMFLHTGLLLKSRNSSEVIGVMAHEAGHIAGGHTIVTSQDVMGPNTISLLSTLLGIAAGVATGKPDLGMAIMMGGQRAAIGQYLTFSRGVESQADQFALKALQGSHQSAKGFYDFFGRLQAEEALYTANQDPYVRSHPITRDRMDSVLTSMEASPYTNQPPDPELERQYRRMVAKLYAFLKPQIATLQKYPEKDTSVEARYARVIAYYRRSQFDKAMPLVDGLLAEMPKDPFFWQIKGDMLLSRSKTEPAIEAYREALKVLPNATEIIVAMAHAMVESRENHAADAQAALKHALAIDAENPEAWDLLATAYNRDNDPGMSAYAAAERAILTGQFGDVARYSNQAEKLLEKDTPTWYRLQDIKVVAQNALRDMKDRRR